MVSSTSADAIFLLATQASPQAGPHRLVGFLRQLQVFEHAQGFEHRRLLELATDAGLGDLHFAHLRQVEGFTEPGLAVTGPGLAGDHVHQRGLARAVGADDAAQFADADVQVQIVQRLETIEADADVFQGQDGAVAGVQAGADALAEADGVAAAAGVLVGLQRGKNAGSSMNSAVAVTLIVHPFSSADRSRLWADTRSRR